MKEVHMMIILSSLASAGCNKPPKAGAAAEPRGGMVMVPDTSETELKSTGADQTGRLLMMQAHIDSMARMSPEQMTRAMATHEQMMSQMLDQMGAEMRTRPGMGGSSALIDTVKQDLAALPSLRGQALSSRMHAHVNRVRRLVAMQKKMMLEM